MAETSPATPSPATPSPGADSRNDTALRGELVIKERAVAKIVIAAALQTAGVVRQSSGLARLTGRELPRADISMGAEAVAVNLYIALGWPCRLDALHHRLRAEVSRQVEELTGMPVHELNVIVAGTEPLDTGTLDTSTLDTGHTTTDTGDRPAREEVAQTASPVPVHPRTPRAMPAAVPAAIVVAVTALGLALVSARELLIKRGTLNNAPWLRNTFEWLGRLHWSHWILPVAAGSIVLGAVFIVLALAPRPRTHLPIRVNETPIVWLRPTDLARKSSSQAGTVAGVQSAHTTVDRKHITVRVLRSDSSSAAEVAISVREAVEPTLSLLGTSPELRVRVKP